MLLQSSKLGLRLVFMTDQSAQLPKASGDVIILLVFSPNSEKCSVYNQMRD